MDMSEWKRINKIDGATPMVKSDQTVGTRRTHPVVKLRAEADTHMYAFPRAQGIISA
jgi:hypothetical protein